MIRATDILVVYYAFAIKCLKSPQSLFGVQTTTFIKEAYMNNRIYISGYFDDSEKNELKDIEQKLSIHQTSLSVRNLKGCIMNSALDFADYEIIMFSYELFKTFVLSGSYDIFKCFLIQLWEKVGKSEKAPFTIGIENIPINDSHENIKIKIDGKLTRRQKDNVINRAFNLVDSLISNDFKLKERSKFYNAFNAHLLKYNTLEDFFEEIDIETEILDKSN